jgi:hypothetical protein
VSGIKELSANSLYESQILSGIPDSIDGKRRTHLLYEVGSNFTRLYRDDFVAKNSSIITSKEMNTDPKPGDEYECDLYINTFKLDPAMEIYNVPVFTGWVPFRNIYTEISTIASGLKEVKTELNEVKNGLNELKILSLLGFSAIICILLTLLSKFNY